jgi:UDP-GlcNAc3NAcA epimerase
MSDIFFEQMDIPAPSYALNINQLSHAEMTGKMMIAIEEILIKEQPEMVLVYGDTNSTMAGALAAKKLLIDVAHVEAGLRSYNRNMPEEINRIVTDSISDIAFCPTKAAMDTLEQEGFRYRSILTGDVMLDASKYFSKYAQAVSEFSLPEFVLATFHRQENTDDKERLREVVRALNELHSFIPVVIPIHPRTSKRIEQEKLDLQVHKIDPVGYFQMIWLLENCKAVVTDSGGLQKEAYFFRKPCLTLRDETEWVELVSHGSNKLVPPSGKINLNAELNSFGTIDFDKELYGKGNASEIIAEELLKFHSS